jgi:hypothetical protein
MKKTFLVFLFSILCYCSDVSAQEKKVKTGWNFGGALPAITYDSDLGFEYGALAEFFNYGDGSKYPDFIDHTYTEISTIYKRKRYLQVYVRITSHHPRSHWISDLSYLPTRQLLFTDTTDMNRFIIKIGWMINLLLPRTGQECFIVIRRTSSDLKMISRENFMVII